MSSPAPPPAAAILDAVPYGVVVTDPDGAVTLATPRFCALAGAARADLLGRPAPLADAPAPGERRTDVLARDGGRLPVVAASAPIDGLGLVTVVRPLDPAAATDEAARRSRADLEQVQRIARLGSWVYDIEARSVSWSDEVYRILGLEPREGPETLERVMSAMPADERVEVTRAVEQTIATGVPYRLEHRVVRPDGSERIVLEQAELERGPDGSPERLIGTVLDITERRRSEEEAIGQSRRAELLAEERGRLVADALNAEERTRRRIAEALHDDVLQDLLITRQDLMEAAEAVDPSEALSRALAGLDRATTHLRQSVGELHPVTLTHGGFNVAIETLAEQASRRASLEADVRVDPGAAGMHDQLVFSLLRELLMNVERHAEARHVWVVVRGTREGLDLEVRDDGRGMAPEREREAIREGHIGLASARERVRALDGTLELESAPGLGTRVAVRLPAPLAGAERA